MTSVAKYQYTLIISQKTAFCPQTFGVGEATTRVKTKWPKAPQTHLTSIQMGCHMKIRISTNPEEVSPDTTMTENVIVLVMILLNNLDTFIKALTPHLVIMIQIIQRISILPTKERMEPEGEAEVEGGQKGTEV